MNNDLAEMPWKDNPLVWYIAHPTPIKDLRMQMVTHSHSTWSGLCLYPGYPIPETGLRLLPSCRDLLDVLEYLFILDAVPPITVGLLAGLISRGSLFHLASLPSYFAK